MTAPLLVRACRREPVERTPVWFMRQAGRCLEEYRALRERFGILEIARTPELCARVTAMPVDRLGVDAAVLYADIMLPLDGMGVPFHIEPDLGPIVERPLRSGADVAALRVVAAEEATPYLFETIRALRGDLRPETALVGFAGAPFTLASYLVEGRPSRDHALAKKLLFGEPVLWDRLMTTLVEVVSRYLVAQVAAGVDAVQLFDSWAGALAPQDYARASLPYTREIFRRVGGRVPRIHFATGNPALTRLFADTGILKARGGRSSAGGSPWLWSRRSWVRVPPVTPQSHQTRLLVRCDRALVPVHPPSPALHASVLFTGHRPRRWRHPVALPKACRKSGDASSTPPQREASAISQTNSISRPPSFCDSVSISTTCSDAASSIAASSGAGMVLMNMGTPSHS